MRAAGFFCFLLVCFSATAQLKTHSFTEAEVLMKETKQPTVVFIYTDWCKYCHTMKNTTFQDISTIELLNTNYQLVQLNAEAKNFIRFFGNTFNFNSTSGVHDLAQQLGKVEGKLTYPTICVLSPKMEIIFQHQGFLSAEELQKVLKK